MKDLKYAGCRIYVEGVITGISDCAVEVELKGRLGTMKLPLRMMILEKNPQLGQAVGFVMSYPELLTHAESN